MTNAQRIAMMCNYRLADISVDGWIMESETVYRVPLKGMYNSLELIWVRIPIDNIVPIFHNPLDLSRISYDLVLLNLSYSCLGLRQDGSEEETFLSRERLLLMWPDRKPVYDCLYFVPVSSIQKEGNFWVVSWISSFLYPDSSVFVTVPETDVFWQVDTDTLDYRVFFGHVVFSQREVLLSYKNRNTGWHMVNDVVLSEDLAKDYAYSCRADGLHVKKTDYINALNDLLGGK